MLKGRRSIYVDYVDYDAVAHHAGVLRPESMAALEGIDAVLAQLEQVAAVAPRKYHLVVLSDHGQSQGAVFADRYGEDLATLVARLADADVVAAGDNHEGVGSLNAVIAGSSSDDTVLGRALGRTSDRVSEGTLKGAHDAAAVEQSEATDDRGGRRRRPVHRLRLGQPRPRLRRGREAPAHPPGAHRPLPRTRPRPGGARGRRLRRGRHRRLRTGRDRQAGRAPRPHRRGRRGGPARGLR